MSLFIGGLAFEHVGGDAATYLTTHRIGILSGSLIAGISGYFGLLDTQVCGLETFPDR
jgi:NhaA family Na+:H+ antiporter